MGLFDKLKAIGISLPKLKSLLHLNISVSIDNSVHIDGETVNINPARLGGKQKRALKELIRKNALDDAGAIITADVLGEVEEVKKLLPAMEPMVDYFRALIPAEDIPLLRACLVLRARHTKGLCIEKEKSEIIQSYGPRGGHLANLCSAGYLESWFQPFHEQLLKDNGGNTALAKEKFIEHYRNILNDMPWTVFVSRCQKAKLAELIIEKMGRNQGNGIYHIHVHGIGLDNVKRIVAAIPDIQSKIGAVPVQMDRDVSGTRISVRLEIPRTSRSK